MKKTIRKKARYAICLNNEGYAASLEVGRIYQVVPDKEAAAHGYLRLIDESGEDYAFDAHRFYVIELPAAVSKSLSLSRP